MNGFGEKKTEKFWKASFTPFSIYIIKMSVGKIVQQNETPASFKYI